MSCPGHPLPKLNTDCNWLSRSPCVVPELSDRVAVLRRGLECRSPATSVTGNTSTSSTLLLKGFPTTPQQQSQHPRSFILCSVSAKIPLVMSNQRSGHVESGRDQRFMSGNKKGIETKGAIEMGCMCLARSYYSISLSPSPPLSLTVQ